MTDFQRAIIQAIFTGVTGDATPKQKPDVHPYQGKNVFIRTVTYHYTGKVVGVKDGFLILDEAAWIADSGRWGEALQTGSLNEIEPYPGECLVSIGSIIDMSPWNHDLPRKVK